MVENFRGTISALLRRRSRPIALVSLALIALVVSVGFFLPGRSSAPLSTRVAHPEVRTLDGAAAQSAAASTPVAVAAAPLATTPTTPAVSSTPTGVSATSVTTTSVAATNVATTSVATSTAATPVEPSIATLVAEVEAAGIEPGSNWSWSTGDTATHCGVITGAGTGCTFGAAGLEQTVFAGSPTLALVAHELANAETQNDAVPDLLNEVGAVAGTTSWSPTDAVASCLVAHFMGFQDGAAGTWQCSSALASFVAANIHDTLSTVVAVAPR
jgi:hypothetical protein